MYYKKGGIMKAKKELRDSLKKEIFDAVKLLNSNFKLGEKIKHYVNLEKTSSYVKGRKKGPYHRKSKKTELQNIALPADLDKKASA